ncbi:hypothetical protein EW026_g4835 [Hermanssonia centrifuga]|uniref:Survival protein SurE-like phosphatase/nucleotidase domain-containing protein n=1 Tax=Hermanssonia centrifuga TaxID=98765 RepID=A0A4S4KG06_9APHY|nr:hypothetical protein EW026_g4835 [Hermanssonia centrifuga]
MSTTPTPLTEPCEFNSCPTGSPAEGFNASDTRLNYVNAFPVDSIRFGIETLAPTFFGDAKPDFVASGPNIGGNTGFSVFGSGTIGAAFEAAKEGIPSAAFSASGGTQHEAWTDLTTAPTSPSVLSAISYSSLAVKFLSALFAQPPSSAVLPPGVILNVNFPPLSDTYTVLDRSQEGAIAKWLRRLIRILNYQLLFEGAGSNPAGVEFVLTCMIEI